jgi:hypothetical protein
MPVEVELVADIYQRLSKITKQVEQVFNPFYFFRRELQERKKEKLTLCGDIIS